MGANRWVVVIGGGAAGLMAAGQAAEEGARVLLLERSARLGTKLRITGKGRCNLTNMAEFDDLDRGLEWCEDQLLALLAQRILG